MPCPSFLAFALLSLLSTPSCDPFICLLCFHLSLHPPAFLSVHPLLCFAAIPFIVHPIDNGIHALMNASFRPAIKKFICGPGQGGLADLDMCEDECNVAEEGESSALDVAHVASGVVGVDVSLLMLPMIA